VSRAPDHHVQFGLRAKPYADAQALRHRRRVAASNQTAHDGSGSTCSPSSNPWSRVKHDHVAVRRVDRYISLKDGPIRPCRNRVGARTDFARRTRPAPSQPASGCAGWLGLPKSSLRPSRSRAHDHVCWPTMGLWITTGSLTCGDALSGSRPARNRCCSRSPIERP